MPSATMQNRPDLAPKLSDHPQFAKLKQILIDGFVRTGFDRVTRVPLEYVVQDMLSDARIDEQIGEMRRYMDLEGKKILEVGSGCGALVTRGRVAYGLDISGIEPSVNEFTATLDVGRRLLSHFNLPPNALQDAFGEAIPFPDEHFDFVYSSNVLEHVQSPQKVISESLRVLKPGGLLLFVVPNYGSWWEGHYGILWLPHMPAWMAKLYVRMFGRDPDYIDTLNLLSKGRIEKLLRPFKEEIEVLDWGSSVFEHRLRSLDFSGWAALRTAKKIAGLVHKLQLVKPAIVMSRVFHWETPLVLAVRKK
ncbi:class I SAM-dependent methyltransferase [Microvirga puerhi]|uniref:Class I SAM-dependent methyltransferase n=1 Tax=Microvirga puerhi TaxID=2876078 RepID=A0ABS7VM85_9HYPH|nr:class I SAM-dependent methyltransferase [Microvirga puerhi]MBZ6076255.1 class I SAM-dependent methyltransferase [Microvirga puerhi]